MNPALGMIEQWAATAEFLGTLYGVFLFLAVIVIGCVLAGTIIGIYRWWDWTYRDLYDPSTWLHGGRPPILHRLKQQSRPASPRSGAVSRSASIVANGHANASRTTHFFADCTCPECDEVREHCADFNLPLPADRASRSAFGLSVVGQGSAE